MIGGRGFNLKTMVDATPASNIKEQVREIPVNMLTAYHNHKFQLYNDDRKEDMKESIRKNGIFSPLVVQPINDGENYEILIGHNRWNCAKELGMTTVPCIIKQNLDADEAETYVVESNVMQRGFDNLTISERALVMKERYNSMFSQGKRNDIINELETLEYGEQGRTSEKLGTEYGMGKSNVARYVRLGYITNPEIKKWLDTGQISIRAGVELSYLAAEEENMLADIIKEPKKQLTEKNAKSIRYAADECNLTVESLLDIVTRKKTAKKKINLILPEDIVEKYFTNDDGTVIKKDKIFDTIREALGMLYE